MNGFVIFSTLVDVKHFLKRPEIRALASAHSRLVKSANRQPVVTFRGMTQKEISTISFVANQTNGEIRSSFQFVVA